MLRARRIQGRGLEPGPRKTSRTGLSSVVGKDGGRSREGGRHRGSVRHPSSVPPTVLRTSRTAPHFPSIPPTWRTRQSLPLPQRSRRATLARSMTCTKNVDTRDVSANAAFGPAPQPREAVETRKSNATKAVSPCRHFRHPNACVLLSPSVGNFTPPSTQSHRSKLATRVTLVASLMLPRPCRSVSQRVANLNHIVRAYEVIALARDVHASINRSAPRSTPQRVRLGRP